MPLEGIPLNGARVRAARHRKLMRQDQLAELVGITSRSVSRWETTSCRVTPDNIRALNTALGLPQDSQHFVTFDDWPPSTTDKAHT